MVMKPYFWPRGVYNKLRTISTFAVMAGSKVCGIYSPLYIGMAVQRLTDEKVVPYYELAMYAGLSFGVQAQAAPKHHLSWCQTASLQKSPKTPFDICTASLLDWHLKKNGGNFEDHGSRHSIRQLCDELSCTLLVPFYCPGLCYLCDILLQSLGRLNCLLSRFYHSSFTAC